MSGETSGRNDAPHDPRRLAEQATPAGYRPANPFITRSPHFGAGYPVQLPVFEGPLDLLLYLIEREELDVTEVSLVAVTDQYLQTIETWEEVEPGALADFLVVASRLLYIKSSRLLPRPPASDDGEEESPDSLIRHLLEYRRFKRIAEALREREARGAKVFGRVAPPPGIDQLGPRPPDLSLVDLPLLQIALRRALARMPDDPPLPKVQAYAVTVAEKIDEVRSLVRTLNGQRGGGHLTFARAVASSRSRMEIVVTFLAVLELVKQQEISAVQDRTFGEILLVAAHGRDPHGAAAA